MPTGHLRTETGVHRSCAVAVRLRQPPTTSFSSVFVYPEVDDSIEMRQPRRPARDTYRASGAGGQHSTKRLGGAHHAHSTNIVVQMPDDRSQHRNRRRSHGDAESRMYEEEVAQTQCREAGVGRWKIDIGWDQIRSYVLDQSASKACAPITKSQ